MKTKVILFLLFAASSISGTAQTEYQLRKLMDFVNGKKVISGELHKELSESDIEGSAYLNAEFTNGALYTLQKEKYVDVPLRYNLYNDEMEFKNSQNEILAIADPGNIERIEIGNAVFYYMPYLLGKKTINGYFELIISGNVSLYTKHKVSFLAAEVAGAYKDAKPPRFERSADEYFIKNRNNPASIISNKKDLLDILSDHNTEIESFVKKNKTKVNDLDDLIGVVKYYNSL